MTPTPVEALRDEAKRLAEEMADAAFQQNGCAMRGDTTNCKWWNGEANRLRAELHAVIDRLAEGAGQHPAGGPRQLVSVSSIDIEKMLAACLPGGQSCDPQQAADAIRRYCDAWPAGADEQGLGAPASPSGFPLQPPAAASAAIPGADAMTREVRMAVMLAYGHLWHVNNEPMAPTPLYLPERAAYAARSQLRDLLTKQERGEAINQVGVLIGRYGTGQDS